MKKVFLAQMLFVIMLNSFAQPTPDQLYGQLFADVQLQKIFPDGKTFVDCTPKRKVADIMYDYGMQKGASFNLKKFVEENFNQPAAPPVLNYIQQEKNISAHINNLWDVLKREADTKQEGSSLLPLPFSYIVPGGRFREIYYWDSYFTMLGLMESKRYDIIENMVKNFAYLIDTYGHIPNGNRTYYLSRSQPPFFCMMVDLLARVKGNGVYKTYLLQLRKEYDYWMKDAATIKPGQASGYVVKLKDGTVLNRYWDHLEIPRQESYAEDVETAESAANNAAMLIRFESEEKREQYLSDIRKKTYRNLRAGACSGWDFSNRWFADGENLHSIEIINILPVDLNALMMHMETTLSKAYGISKKSKESAIFKAKALQRSKAILKYFWNTKLDYFTDYNFETASQNSAVTAAGMYPFNFPGEIGAAISKKYCEKAAVVLKNKLLQPGGIACTVKNTKQQWDAPNGWAPLQWMAIMGLQNNGQHQLAADISKRWIKLNTEVYNRTGKLMEKYNVVDMNLEAGGGEYPGQDGFGWTNGTLLALMRKYVK